MNLLNLVPRLSVLKWLLSAIVIVFALASAYVSILSKDRSAALQKISRYDIAWTIAQAVNEFGRLEHRLAAFSVPGSLVPAEEVQLRLDVMFSRLQSFEQIGARPDRQRSLRLFFEDDPDNEAVIVALREALETVDPIISTLEQRPTADLALALKVLEPLDAQLNRLAASASTYAAAQVAADRRELQGLSNISSALAAFFVIFGFLLIILLVVHNELLGRAQTRSRTLADQLRNALADLRVQNSRFDAALNNMPQALCMFDGSGRLAVFNERFREITGLASKLQVGSRLPDLVGQGSPLFRALVAGQSLPVKAGQNQTTLRDVGEQCFAVRHSPLQDGGWLATYDDISDHRRAMNQIVHMAHHDSLTDLPNRLLFNEQLRSALDQMRGTDRELAMFLLDLDNFKDVNDTLGHQIGDELLQQIAARLSAMVGDAACVSRIGGDEFALFRRPADDLDNMAYANALIRSLSQPYHVAGNEIIVGVSIGVAECGSAETPDPQELFRRADLALYRAKDEGRGRASPFEPSLDERLQERKRLELDLWQAQDRGELEVHYQPIVDTPTTQAVGYEALLRWKHPELGYVSPAVFIPIAERSGAIFALGEWVLQQACWEAATWVNQATVAVNLSAVQFSDSLLAERVAHVLQESGLPSHRLELEITESVLLDASDETLASLKLLKAMGIKIAMDDFGTGYSSLSSLRSFPFDKIKIDRSFIQDLPASEDARAVVELIVQLGRLLKMKVTAEGVESEAQLESLRRMSCPQLQGFLFDRPRPIALLRPEHQPPRTSFDIKQKRLA